MELNKPSLIYLRFLALFTGAVSGFWLSFVFYSIHASLPFNPIDLPLAKTLALRVFTPQGWKFFTRNPREETVSVFARDGHGNWSSPSIGRNASLLSYFGLARTARAQGVEVGVITASLKPDQWVPCSERLDACLAKTPTAAAVANVSPGATVCGDIVFVKQQPVPWAWTRSKRTVTMPITCLRVNVSCSQVYPN